MHPFVMFLLTGTAIYIAYRQWKTAAERLRMDLFDKRLDVYRATKNFLRSIASSGKVEDDAVHKLFLSTDEAKWLFDDEIARFIDTEITQKAIDLQSVNSELDGIPRGPERSENLQRQKELKRELREYRVMLDNKCARFLKIKQ